MAYNLQILDLDIDLDKFHWPMAPTAQKHTRRFAAFRLCRKFGRF